MRALICLLFGLCLFLVSCSSSRMMDADLAVSEGRQVRGTILRSNIWVEKGSQLDVRFSSGNRFYVSAGGCLSGFDRGARDSTIYAEKGARLPARKFLQQIKVVWVNDAELAYQKRYRKLPPLRGLGGGGLSNLSVSEDDDDCDEDHGVYRGARAVSVSPDSYRKKD